MNRTRVIAASLTAVVALLIVGLLLLVHLQFDRSTLPDPPRSTAGLLEEEPEEEYAELYTPEQGGADVEPLPAYAPEPSVEAPRGEQELPTSMQELPTSMANSEVANAFANFGASANGDGGKPSGVSSPVSGEGTGTVGGGWTMPQYAKVSSEQTGSVVLRAVVDRSGKVVKVEQIGGKAPAAANARLVEACKGEVRSRTFTRTNDNAPERAIATITYVWK